MGSHKSLYVAWGGEAYTVTEYEVLCNFEGKWIQWQGSVMPRNGFIAGTSEVNNESLYVARATVNGTLKVGKIHPCYGKAYIPHKGREVEFSEYEILIVNDKKKV